MKNELSENLYLRARAAAFQASLAIVAAVAGGISGLMTLPNDGFWAWMGISFAACALGLGLMRSAKAVRLTRYAVNEEAREWLRNVSRL